MRTKSVTLRGSLVVGSTVDYLGRASEVIAAFAAPAPAVIPTFEHGFMRFNKEAALSALEYAKSGLDCVDMYYEARRNGMTDAEYRGWVNELRLPLTKGQYFLEWSPARVGITEEVRQLAEGLDPEAVKRFADSYSVVKDTSGGSWLMSNSQRRKKELISRV